MNILTEKIRAQIEQHSLKNLNEEVCGFIVAKDGQLDVFAINKVNVPNKNFLVSPVDIKNAEIHGKIVGFYRSSPCKSNSFSDADIKTSKLLRIPCVLYYFSGFDIYTPPEEKKGLVKITLHGKLGQIVGKKWKLAVKSVGEAMRAIETNSRHKLYRFFYNNDKLGLRYKVLINGRDFLRSEPVTIENPRSIANSELVCKINDLETIDIVPVMEGSDAVADIFTAILGAILVVVGIIISAAPGAQPGGVALIMAGLGLIGAGVMNLLSKPPKFEDFREIDSSKGRQSYLFSGPQNTTQEGGPVPVGYGRLIVGSQVVSASYAVKNVDSYLGEIDYEPGFNSQIFNPKPRISAPINCFLFGQYNNNFSFQTKYFDITDISQGYFGYGASGGGFGQQGSQGDLVLKSNEPVYVEKIFLSNSYLYAIIKIKVDTGTFLARTSSNSQQRQVNSAPLYHKYLVRKSLSSTEDTAFEFVNYLTDGNFRDSIRFSVTPNLVSTELPEAQILVSNNTISTFYTDLAIKDIHIIESVTQNKVSIATQALLTEKTLFDISKDPITSEDSDVYKRLRNTVNRILYNSTTKTYYYLGSFASSGTYSGRIAKASSAGNILPTTEFANSITSGEIKNGAFFTGIDGQKILICGNFNSGTYLSVLKPDGTIDSEYSFSHSFSATPAPVVNAVAFDTTESILYVVGQFQIGDIKNIAKFTLSDKTFTLDTTFDVSTSLSDYDVRIPLNFKCIAIQQRNNKILVGGQFALKANDETTYSSYAGLIRLNTDGTFDNSFNKGLKYENTDGTAVIVGTLGTVNQIFVCENADTEYYGRIIIGGNFTTYNNATAYGLAVLTNGSYETS